MLDTGWRTTTLLSRNVSRCQHARRTSVAACRQWQINHQRTTNSKHVTTWSPLAATFNARPAHRLGIRISGKSTGLFGIGELRDSTGFYGLKERAVEATDRLVAESCSQNRTQRMVAVFDELSDTLCKVADLAEFIRIAHPDARYVNAAADTSLSINALVEKLNTNQDIYWALQRVVENGDVMPTDEVDQHVARLFLFDFEQSGIHLNEEKRKRVVKLNECILQIGALFMQGTSLARAVPKDKLPEGIRPFFASQGGDAIVPGLSADSPNEMVREAAYKIFMYPDDRQEGRLLDLLTSREELAQLCGFPTFAHRALRGSLAGSPEVVAGFLDALSNGLKPYARADLEEMRKVKTGHVNSSMDLHMWDIPYLSACIRQEKFQIDPADYAPYFSLGTCMEGLNLLFDHLYSVTLQSQETAPGELWSPDVHKLAVVHKTEGTLGYIYCDFLERPGKPNQDCHFTIRGGRELPDGSYQLPVVVLHLNFPTPTWTCPCLLSPSMVENLFHEMGHAMHSMLARTKYQHVTGTRCSTDFAEVPSVLMEYFASDPRVLSHFARDYKTGQKIPYEMLVRLQAAKSALSANDLQLQVFYAALDQQYHGDLKHLRLRGTDRESTTDILDRVQAEYYCLPHVPKTAWQLRFGHLVGYGAKYYSYLMSKAVASWIWQKCFRSNPFDRNSGERYRREVLAHGGGRPPKQLLEGFLQQEVAPNNLVESLISEVASRHPYN